MKVIGTTEDGFVCLMDKFDFSRLLGIERYSLADSYYYIGKELEVHKSYDALQSLKGLEKQRKSALEKIKDLENQLERVKLPRVIGFED